MSKFIENKPELNSTWRAIILFGRNVASYKFALGKALLELSSSENTLIKLDQLANPFTKYLIEHIETKQGTFNSSKFLDSCKKYSKQEISKNELIEKTVQLGFNNVIDAFHIVGQTEVPERFFIDQRKSKNGIILTDNIYKLADNIQFSNLPIEVEARWRLVETAWSLNVSPKLLEVKYDPSGNELFIENDHNRRINITSCRDSLNGYQKGKCFFCFSDITIEESDRKADVDHFFPHVLFKTGADLNLNGVWNLVLSCINCNRGENGKFERIPEIYLLDRLHTRNEFLINSHHPLRETIINQTGLSENERINFLSNIDKFAIANMIHRWKPNIEHEKAF